MPDQSFGCFYGTKLTPGRFYARKAGRPQLVGLRADQITADEATNLWETQTSDPLPAISLSDALYVAPDKTVVPRVITQWREQAWRLYFKRGKIEVLSPACGTWWSVLSVWYLQLRFIDMDGSVIPEARLHGPIRGTAERSQA